VFFGDVLIFIREIYVVLRLTNIFTRLSVTDRRSILSTKFEKGCIYIVILGIFEGENAHGFFLFFSKISQKAPIMSGALFCHVRYILL
jgi:hypothetical protein